MRIVMLAVFLLAAWPAAAVPLALQRGVGVHEWLNWSPLAADGSYRWPPYQSVDEWRSRYRDLADWPAGDEFVRIRSLGFDFVRLTVDPGPLLATDGEKRQEALDVLAASVNRVAASGLKVVLNLHIVPQVPAYGGDAIIEQRADSASVARYVAMTADVARMLVPLGTDRVAFEPFNEPQHYPCEGRGDGQWQEIMTSAMSAIRAVSAELTVVATGACGGDVSGLVDLDPDFDDSNLYFSFHMYEPHVFTHQRPEDEGGFASSLPWPASSGSAGATSEMLRAHMAAAGVDEAEQERTVLRLGPVISEYFTEGWGESQVAARIGEALDWAARHDIPASRLFMGEFGVIEMSDDGRMGAFAPDRLRYLEAVRLAAERHGIPWSVWEYANPWGMSVILPTGPAVPDTQMLRALGLQPD
ncbi:cellulase family glycosylhydrolase [Devosia sp. ZB163]|uniref:glycoside hydrolase family 5 protein n=1 Tax=Devosia sp. ZB163 TaxID=3025938 RepID=UPI0023612692|nr:cellulase family glycosylhydrolase [Devosia sp. ZB163]MDC9826302.1 cellulase family glycosylhydrolase [Devosia sp. ZB163]